MSPVSKGDMVSNNGKSDRESEPARVQRFSRLFQPISTPIIASRSNLSSVCESETLLSHEPSTEKLAPHPGNFISDQTSCCDPDEYVLEITDFNICDQYVPDKNTKQAHYSHSVCKPIFQALV